MAKKIQKVFYFTVRLWYYIGEGKHKSMASKCIMAQYKKRKEGMIYSFVNIIQGEKWKCSFIFYG